MVVSQYVRWPEKYFDKHWEIGQEKRSSTQRQEYLWLDPQMANIVLLLTFVSTKVDRDRAVRRSNIFFISSANIRRTKKRTNLITKKSNSDIKTSSPWVPINYRGPISAQSGKLVMLLIRQLNHITHPVRFGFYGYCLTDNFVRPAATPFFADQNRFFLQTQKINVEIKKVIYQEGLKYFEMRHFYLSGTFVSPDNSHFFVYFRSCFLNKKMF